MREKDEIYIISLESVTSIKKRINSLKVVYQPINCFLHHYINPWMTAMVQMTGGNRLVDIRKDWWLYERLVTLGKTSNYFLSFIQWFDLDRLMAYSFMSDVFDFNQELNPQYVPIDEWLMREISRKQIFTFVATL